MITQENKDNILKLIAETEPLIKEAKKKLVITLEPENPDNIKQSWLTPELHKMMNLQDQLKSFFKNFTPSKESKQTGMSKWLPFIAIGVAVLIGVMLYMENNSMKVIINMMQLELQQMHNLINSLRP